jgi:hypothetical protein
MTTETPTTTKEQIEADLALAKQCQQFAIRRAKELVEQLEIRVSTLNTGIITLAFRYGRESEPIELRGNNAREKFRDLGVHIERFLGART